MAGCLVAICINAPTIAAGAAPPRSRPLIYNFWLLQIIPSGSLWKERMPTDVVMPQMGESIFEGTITKWLKKPGDKVQRDEPLFEISTDKVDAEIPAPSTGVLREIKVQAGATVQVNTVVAVIGGAGGGAATSAPAPAAVPAAAPAPTPAPVAASQAAVSAAPPVAAAVAAPGERRRSSPLVRRIAREANTDLAGIP